MVLFNTVFSGVAVESISKPDGMLAMREHMEQPRERTANCVKALSVSLEAKATNNSGRRLLCQ